MDECGKLSARYRCRDCGDGRMLANVRELRAHRGPAFDHWLTRCRAAFGVTVPVDDGGDTE